MVKIKLFASYREKVGKEQIEISIDKEIEAKKLLKIISEKYKLDLNGCLVAKNNEYIKMSDKIKNDDVIYLLPPVSGG